VSDVESDMHGIGELARASGLTVSALRFYDRAGVLVPAFVDPVTGYRWYRADQVRAARLIGALRRVGMPVADIAAAVRALPEPASVRPLLDRHLRRLEDGLADARRELLRAHTLLDLEDHMTRVTLPAAEFAAALAAVRFAAAPETAAPETAGPETAGPDTAAPETAGPETAGPETAGPETAGPETAGPGEDGAAMLTGILFEAGDNSLTLVATDRFRLAAATAPATVEGPPIRVVVPAAAIGTPGRGDDPVTLTLTAGQVTIGSHRHPAIAGADYPDFRRLVRPPAGPAITVDVAALRTAVTSVPDLWREHDGRAYPTTVLTVDDDGGLRVAGADEWARDVPAHVAVNRDYLLQALDAGGAGQLVLELDGPIHPLAIRSEEHDRFSLLMPVRH